MGRRLLGMKCTNKACPTNAEKENGKAQKEGAPLVEAAWHTHSVIGMPGRADRIGSLSVPNYWASRTA